MKTHPPNEGALLFLLVLFLFAISGACWIGVEKRDPVALALVALTVAQVVNGYRQ